MYIGKQPQIGNYQTCDSITATATDTFNLTVGNVAVSPISAHHCLVSLNGILQAPISSYTISGSTIVFASALTTSDSIDFITILGHTLDTGTPSDGTVTTAKLASASVTNAKLGTDVISGETDIGGAIADADLILVDDGAGGTLRKSAMSRVKTYIGGDNTPAFAARLSTGQSISNGTETKVTCNTEVFDTDGLYDNSTNYRFTPTTAGKYLIVHGVRGTLSAARWVAWIRRNGATDHAVAETNPNSSGSNPSCLGACIIDLDGTDDYVELFCYQNSGGSITLGNSSTYDNTFFQGFKLIGV